MTIITASQGDRLDQIVAKVYGTVAVYETVLSENEHLADRLTLEAGDVVYLPDIPDETPAESAGLW